MIPLNISQNRQDAAQIPAMRAFSLAGAEFLRRVVSAAAVAFISAVRITHLYRTPSLGGQRPDCSDPLSAALPGGRVRAVSARVFAHRACFLRNNLPFRPVLSCIWQYEHSGNKGKIQCQTPNGSQLSFCAPGLPPVATPLVNRRLSAQVPGSARRFCLTPTRLPRRLWRQGATCSIASKIRTSADALILWLHDLRQTNTDFFRFGLTAVRPVTRGGFVYAMQSNKRDTPCSARS
jgi:hypothetical protein